MSDPITDLAQEITILDKTSGPYYLAAKLILVEDPATSSFFEEKSDELKRLFVQRQKSTEESVIDVYGINEIAE